MAELLFNDADYMNALERIKREISRARSRAVLAVNGEVICMYWRIGKLIDLCGSLLHKFPGAIKSEGPLNVTGGSTLYAGPFILRSC